MSKGYQALIDKFNGIAETYGGFFDNNTFLRIFTGSAATWNQPEIQNGRVKAVSSLPVSYTKNEIAEFLRTPYNAEKPLRETSEILRYTAYPYFKIVKTYQDIPTYRYYTKPLYPKETDTLRTQARANDFERDERLLDKFCKELKPEKIAHKIVGQVMTDGKVFYYPRYSVRKDHNNVEYAYLQQLPQDYCTIIGFNNVSGYTVSFDMMYFLTPGSDPIQYGELFLPYKDGFDAMFEPPKRKGKRTVYMSTQRVGKRGSERDFYPENLDPGGEGSPRVFMQNGRWMYWVTLPVDKVWTFEADDTDPAVVPPLAGLMLTYAQQADFEEIQKELLTNPLLKIFTGEIPYFTDNGSKDEDAYRLSNGGRALFEAYFNALMSSASTGGAAFFTAPVQNIKSHDYAESANANDISESFNRYASGKSGLSALIPVDDDIKAAQVEVARLLEGRFATATVYPQFERMMNYIYDEMNLSYAFEFVMFGTIFNEKEIRENAMKAISNGDISAHYILAALDGQSLLDKKAMMQRVKDSGILDMLIPPVTSYTMKQETSGLPPQGGRPQTDDMSDAKEEYIDAYGGVTNG